MKYLLDTNVVIAILKADNNVLTRLLRHRPSDFGISGIVAHELFYGAYKSARREHNLSTVEALQFEVLEFDREDARRSGHVRAFLAAAGTPIGPYDVLIAGQALARDLTLITNSMQEFERVPGLRVENWEQVA